MINTILQGDALEILKTLPDESINCCVTSPPYWGLRDYQVDGQLGLEKSPEEYVAKMVEVFREVKRVLRKDGTCWLNLGDSYNGSGKASGRCWEEGRIPNMSQKQGTNNGSLIGKMPLVSGLKPKDLCGIPWRCAFALQADGWYLRSDIIWAKPNPMPESVTDRPTKAHEYVFLMSKSERYWYDQEAVREIAEHRAWKPGRKNAITAYPGAPNRYSDGPSGFPTNEMGRNVRTVWNIATHSFPEAHFATFPPELAERCIKAGCPEGGVVLDPFMGAGTVGMVAKKLQRNYIGIELNPEYVVMAEKRIERECGGLF